MQARRGDLVSPTATVVLLDGVQVVVPDSLDLITPYVLQEQKDWFEDEIKFLRRLLQPGEMVIDIGANYGVYALSMARTVGPRGRVWAFEPASATAKLLSEGISVNGYSQVILERSALSSSCGTAQLSLNDHSELNALVRGKPSTNASETVPVVTLDECLRRHDWRDIAFMKVDAEGEEAEILKGGALFFSELSPLVQYEVKAGKDLHMELAQDFAALGYDSYRLVPGLDLLVPFDGGSTPDGYLLNLFCCKRDRAERLARQGFLVETKSSEDISGTVRNGDTYDWRQTIARLPYGARLADVWEHTVAEGNSAEVERALSFYALSQDSSRSSTERFGALEASLGLLNALCRREASHLRLASLARVARDYGARSLAVNALKRLSDVISQNRRVDVSEPFLPPGERFDSLAPGEALGNWVLASVLEEYERLGSFSSIYTGISARQRLETIRALGFGSAEMERRLGLLYRRFALPAS